MKVYALVGKSGTGKSFQAINLCKEKEISSIIDDGLFIYNSEVKAGISAKKQSTTIGAIKTALFQDDKHKEAVKRRIERIKPDSILIIGTSDGMVSKINKRLELPPIEETIYIEEITTKGERELAKKQRHVHGKHVVPVPALQLKRHFSGYFIDQLRIFKSGIIGSGEFAEKAVVRPTYSYLGEFILSEKVIRDIVKITAKSITGVEKIIRVLPEENRVGLKVTILALFNKNVSAIVTASELQKKCQEMIEEMTAFNVVKVNIEIRGVN
ncbi:MAG: hypothetical protein ACRCUS_02920 [Anaerovoracaceae bacterium]